MSTLLLIFLGRAVGFEIGAITGGWGFASVFSSFIVVVLILNLILCGIVVFFLYSLTMSERTRDIGIMKAFGCLPDSVFSIFAVELILIVLLGCIIGTVAGSLTFFVVSTSLNLSFNINWGTVLFLFCVFSCLTLLFGGRPIARAIQMKPAKALSPLYLYGTTAEFTGKSFSRFGLTLRIAFRGLMRRTLQTRNIYLCLTIVLTLVMVAVAGGLISSNTTTNYLERAIGRDIVLVAHENLKADYESLLSQLWQSRPMTTLEFLDSQYTIPKSLTQEISNVDGVESVEKRLLFETAAFEGYGAISHPYDYGVSLIGKGRSCRTYVIGIEPSKTASNWFIDGKNLENKTEKNALVGDSLATKMFVSPLNQEIIFSSQNYKIVGVCIDILNKGNVTYVPLDSLPNSVRDNGENLLFIKTNPENSLSVTKEINDLLTDTDFKALNLNKILEENIDFLRNIWSLIMWLPFLSLVNAGFCLFTFLSMSISMQQREFGLMRVIGVKSRMIIKIAVAQILAILFISVLSGASLGLVITYVFLIPEPVIFSTTGTIIVSLLIAVTFILFLLSLYYISKVARKPILEMIHSF